MELWNKYGTNECIIDVQINNNKKIIEEKIINNNNISIFDQYYYDLSKNFIFILTIEMIYYRKYNESTKGGLLRIL